MDRGHRRRGREPRSLDRGSAATKASEGNRQSPSQSPPSREREREQGASASGGTERWAPWGEEVRATASATGPDRAVRVEQAVPCRPTCLASGPGTACSTGPCQPGPIPYGPGRARTGPKKRASGRVNGPVPHVHLYLRNAAACMGICQSACMMP